MSLFLFPRVERFRLYVEEGCVLLMEWWGEKFSEDVAVIACCINSPHFNISFKVGLTNCVVSDIN